MTRRITIELRIALESQCEFPLDEMAGNLAEDIETLLPSVCLMPAGLPPSEWPCASVTSVAVKSVSEQEGH